MRSIQRLLAIGVAVTAIMSWSLLEFGQETNPSRNKPMHRRASNDVSQEATYGPEATDERGSMGALGIADLRSEVALLRSDLSEVRGQLRRLMQTSSSSAASTKAAQDQPSDTAQDWSSAPLSEQELQEEEANAIEEERQRSLARMQAAEAALRQETTDAVWSAQAVDTIRSAMENDGLAGTVLQDIECRATLCRMEVVHANPTMQSVFENDVRFEVARFLPRAMMHSEERFDGTISATIYLAREGQDLPRPAY